MIITRYSERWEVIVKGGSERWVILGIWWYHYCWCAVSLYHAIMPSCHHAIMPSCLYRMVRCW